MCSNTITQSQRPASFPLPPLPLSHTHTSCIHLLAQTVSVFFNRQPLRVSPPFPSTNPSEGARVTPEDYDCDAAPSTDQLASRLGSIIAPLANTHAHTHARTHARTHTHTYTRADTGTQTHTCNKQIQTYAHSHRQTAQTDR